MGLCAQVCLLVGSECALVCLVGAGCWVWGRGHGPVLGLEPPLAELPLCQAPQRAAQLRPTCFGYRAQSQHGSFQGICKPQAFNLLELNAGASLYLALRRAGAPAKLWPAASTLTLHPT